jgi:hypothetical protein
VSEHLIRLYLQELYHEHAHGGRQRRISSVQEILMEIHVLMGIGLATIHHSDLAISSIGHATRDVLSG